jgi:putative phosphoribosyl transferase
MTILISRSIAMTLSGSGSQGLLVLPSSRARGLIVFAHGSSHFSPRAVYVAESFRQAGFATLLFDLLAEPEAADRSNIFNIPLLAQRLDMAATAGRLAAANLQLPLGFFGTSTGAAAALAAASVRADVAAIVSRAGRPDLAGEALTAVAAATLLIVGGRDRQALALNQDAYRMLRCKRRLETVPGATCLSEEPGALDAVVTMARDWFLRHLSVSVAAMEHDFCRQVRRWPVACRASADPEDEKV